MGGQMADRITKEARSANMAAIRGKDTAPELLVRRVLHAAGFRYSLHRKDLPGKPDIVMPRLGVVIFVHGCFWHRHPRCKAASTPTSNTEFWTAKFDANIQKNKRNLRDLKALGWKVLVVWECRTAVKGLRRVVAMLSRGREESG
jgi:DNA mismatch endonuclease (patch repair protein)